MTDNEKKEAFAWERHRAAAHAMQAGVAMEMNISPGPTSPKHLRVGINSALVDQGALAKLLVDKGVITSLEYAEACATMMEGEKERYEKDLSEYFGRPVTLAGLSS